MMADLQTSKCINSKTMLLTRWCRPWTIGKGSSQLLRWTKWEGGTSHRVALLCRGLLIRNIGLSCPQILQVEQELILRWSRYPERAFITGSGEFLGGESTKNKQIWLSRWPICQSKNQARSQMIFWTPTSALNHLTTKRACWATFPTASQSTSTPTIQQLIFQETQM